MNARRYRIHPQVSSESGTQGVPVFQASYTVENAEGVRGDPVIVSGSFPTHEAALTAALAAGEKVLAQVQ
ncbi:MAG: hypothetical protein ABW154_14045 [Dyella sp.]